MIRRSMVAALLATLASAAAIASDRPIVGNASDGSIVGFGMAKDGDDVYVNGLDIRLQGIASPEDMGIRREPGGPEATAHLHSLVDDKPLRCVPDGTRTRGRIVARCYLGAADVGELQVLAGHARDCPRYSRSRYATAEAKARAAGRDLGAIYSLPSYCR